MAYKPWNPNKVKGNRQFYKEEVTAGKSYWSVKGAVKVWDKDVEVTILKKNPELSDHECAVMGWSLLGETLENANWEE